MFGFRVIDVELDVPFVLARIEAGEVRALRIIGYETHAQAKASIRPGSQASRPGEPPRDKTGILKRFIRYAVDDKQSLVIVGPEYLPRKGQDAPQALEHGGVSVTAQGTSIRIAQRAYMAPALEQTVRQDLSRALTDSVTEG